ncbi:MAG: hypothetical protein WC297_03540 [Candidatus Paceibacterota bacterium]|jgi:hypothetical protein
MRATLDLIPSVTIHPDRVCCFYSPNWQPCKPTKQSFDITESASEQYENDSASPHVIKFDHLLASDRKAHGSVSPIARRKLARAVDYLLLLTSEKNVYSRQTGRQFAMKVAFVTLTLPSTQIHSDNEIKSSCLNQFLIELKKRFKVNRYVWRAEKQKNGNIHFHIVIDRFIPYQSLRDIWNRICEKLGYVSRYRDEMQAWHKGGFRVRHDLLAKWDYKSQLRAYKSGVVSDWNSPNSTDIHSIRKVINLKAYIVKYMSKNEVVNRETGEIDEVLADQEGRIWGCSQDLSNIKGAQVVAGVNVIDEIVRLRHDDKIKMYHDPFFDVYYIRISQLHSKSCPSLFSAFAEYLLTQFNFQSQKSLHYA